MEKQNNKVFEDVDLKDEELEASINELGSLAQRMNTMLDNGLVQKRINVSYRIMMYGYYLDIISSIIIIGWTLNWFVNYLFQ